MKIHLGSVLVCLLVSSATGSVSFWHKDFTMTCPGNGTWYKGNGMKSLFIGKSFTQQYNDSTRGHYSCKLSDGTPTYHFYVKAKVCDNCYELKPEVVIGAICADFLVTLGVILVVYVRSGRTKSAGATPKKTPKMASSASAASSAPPIPSPEYEPLNLHARSDEYSTVHRMG